MGIAYSRQSNIVSDCSSFEGGPTGSKARLGNNVDVSMSNWKEDHDQSDVWGVQYKTGDHQKRHICSFRLAASRYNGHVESINFGLSDSANDKTNLILDIARVARDGLHGGITAVRSNNTPMSFTRNKQNHSIETTIVPYGCSFREGLFVLEMKKKVNSENAYMVTVAHYYVTHDVGLSVAAKIRRNKDHGFVVEVEGPFNHPSAELRKVLVKTIRTGIWSPRACSHCGNGSKASTPTKTGGSNPSFKDDSISQILKQLSLSRNVGEQHYTGLLNSTGYTTGFLNNSIIILIDYKS
ncbi:hypothetical protein VNO77_23714 [Canavalia gladiata]|uniref:Uncharacterized protein n=1 Tax=Canavalia gladiata TaxID=3824 RepID=A0AAN9L898_CANGL